MRDIALTLIVFGVLPCILHNARLGAYVWAWISMMVPQGHTYGFAHSLPFAQLVAICTLVATVFSRDRRAFPFNGITIVYIGLLLWMSFTSLFALNTPEVVFDRLIFVMKIHVMLFVTLMLLRGREQIENLVWVCVISLGFYGVKGGMWTLLTGGGGRVWGPPGGMAADNNSFGLAMVMLLPFLYYFYQVSIRRWLRLGLLLSVIAFIFAILGSQSRGALLALIAMAGFLGLKGKRPVLTSLLLASVVFVAIGFMPDSWTGRMKTIDSYEQDSSAMGRLYTWKTLWALAVDRPLVGGGFNVDTPAIFATYAPAEGAGIYRGQQVLVAHSIYFQMLGEHGFVGLGLYLLLWYTTWRKAGILARQTRDHPSYGSWVPLLMNMTQVSLTGFAVGGAFLSMAHFDLSYYICSFVILVDVSLREQNKSHGDSAVSGSEASSERL